MKNVEIKSQDDYEAHKDDEDTILIIRSGYIYVSSGSASVEAYGSASVRAYGSASVRAYGSASVEASGSASVRAYDSASVRAYDSASVRAYDSASVRAGSCVPVQTFPYFNGNVTGGVVIKIPNLDSVTAKEWADYYGVDRPNATIVVFKAVDDDLKSFHRFEYRIGQKVSDPLWQDTKVCGNGLHFGPTPLKAAFYFPRATRFLACRVVVADTIVLGDKIKAPTAEVLYEVDKHGNRLTEEG